jgi:hypothetical protein
VWLCDRVFHILMEYTKELVHRHFSTFGQGLLEQRIQSVDFHFFLLRVFGDRVLMIYAQADNVRAFGKMS